MEVQELKKLIRNDDIPNFLIFTGNEYIIQQTYIHQIAKIKNLSISNVDAVKDVLNTLSSKNLISKKRVYVVRDDKAFMSDEKLHSKITNILNGNILVLVLTDVDKRTKLYKQYNKSYVEFNPLKEDVLKRYIQREIDLSDRNCEILMEACDYNYGHCLLEIDKIKRCMNESDVSNSDVTFTLMVNNGTIYIPPRDTLWDFIKAFLQDKAQLAYDLYIDMKEFGTPTFSVLVNLYNNAKQVLQVQTCTSSDIAKSTGLTGWQIRNAKECVNRVETKDLIYLLRLIQKVESGIKQGKIDESIALEYLIVNWF